MLGVNFGRHKADLKFQPNGLYLRREKPRFRSPSIQKRSEFIGRFILHSLTRLGDTKV